MSVIYQFHVSDFYKTRLIIIFELIIVFHLVFLTKDIFLFILVETFSRNKGGSKNPTKLLNGVQHISR